jgi:hypothetical protein
LSIVGPRREIVRTRIENKTINILMILLNKKNKNPEVIYIESSTIQ